MKLANTLRALVVTCAIAATAHANAAPILLVDSNGILTGANGVDVNGTLYNVTFTDGSCNSLFNGCSASSFTFGENAYLASEALLDQVFLNGALGDFDNVPSLVRGCGGVDYCATMIPWGFNPAFGKYSLLASGAGNIRPGFNDDVVSYGMMLDYDTSTNLTINFAIFTVARADEGKVPEPASFALVGLAAAGLGIARRRKSKV